MNKLSQLISATGVIAILVLPMTTYAFSAPLDSLWGKGLPSSITAKISTTKPGSIKQGDEVKFVITVENKSKKKINTSVLLGFYTLPGQVISVMELRDVSGTPNVLRAGLDGPYPDVTSAEWYNQEIPAQSKKEFSLTAKIFFGRVPKTDNVPPYGEVSVFSPDVPTGRGITKQFALPVSSQKTSVVSSKRRPIDNVFYMAFKHYPTDKERPYWEKRFNSYDQIGNYSKEAFLLKEMKAAAAKQIKTK